MCSTNQLNNDKTFYDIAYTQHALWLVKNILNICLYNNEKLIHLPIPWNGATQWKFPDFNLVQAFGLEKTKRKLWASKPTTKILFFTQDQIFYLKFSLTTWLLHFKPLLFLHICSERTSELLFCNFPNCFANKEKLACFCFKKIATTVELDFHSDIYWKSYKLIRTLAETVNFSATPCGSWTFLVFSQHPVQFTSQ